MTLKQAADTITTSEGWMQVDGVRVYRDCVDSYIGADFYDADLADDMEVVALGNDAFSTI